MNYLDWINVEVLHNSILAWTISLTTFLVAWVVLGIVRRIVNNRMRRYSERSGRTVFVVVAELTRRTGSWFLLVVALTIAVQPLTFPTPVALLLSRILLIGILIQVGLWATVAMEIFLEQRRTRELAHNPGAVAAMDVLGFALRVGAWAVLLLIALDNFGIDITALIAGLGIGGIAVALAVQNILGDLFASLSIVMDKPFAVGDFLNVDAHLGNVEKVGLKTTRLRSLSGEQLIFSNADLLSSRIRNYGRMFERRVLFTIGVTYQTPLDKVRLIPAMLREIIEAQSPVRFDRAHFQGFGDFALNFEMVYYVKDPDFKKYMDIQQAINLTIYERFAAEGIEFAYPTQTLYVLRGDEPAGSRAAVAAHG
jgi:small-conductance mechanosensitive channel